MYRKVILVFLTLIQDISLFEKAYAFLVILYSSLIFFLLFQPYVSKKLNKLESDSILVAISISFLICINFSDPSDAVKADFLIIAILLNSLFFFDWTAEFLRLNLRIHHKKINRSFPNLFVKYMAFSLTLKQIRKNFYIILNFRNIFVDNKKNVREMYSQTTNLKDSSATKLRFGNFKKSQLSLGELQINSLVLLTKK